MGGPELTRELRGLLRSPASARARLAACAPGALAAAWPGLSPLEKAAFFRLLDAGPALELYAALPAAEKFLLLCSREQGAAAPLLEELAPAARTLLRRIPEPQFEWMLAAFPEETPR